jgi:peroxiredoxin
MILAPHARRMKGGSADPSPRISFISDSASLFSRCAQVGALHRQAGAEHRRARFRAIVSATVLCNVQFAHPD